MATELLRRSNASNALRSTGPSSPGGKRISSENSRKHGLSGRRPAIDPARAGEAEALRAAYLADLRPATAEGTEAIDVMVAMSLRIDDCRAALVALAVEQAEEAATDWDHARRVEAEATAEGLARRPGTAAARLGETRQGAELMLGRWEALRTSLDRGTWDESDRSSALDLLGVGRDFRKPGQTALDAPEGADATASARAVIEAEMIRLRSGRATPLAGSDERARGRAGTPLGMLLSRPASLIFRYEREAERRYNAALRVALSAPKLEPSPDRRPAPIPTPAPRPASPPPAPATVAAAPPAVPDGAGLILAATFSAAAAEPAVPARPLNRRARRAEASRLRRAGR